MGPKYPPKGSEISCTKQNSQSCALLWRLSRPIDCVADMYALNLQMGELEDSVTPGVRNPIAMIGKKLTKIIKACNLVELNVKIKPTRLLICKI